MSMDLFVLSDQMLGSVEEWQAAIAAEGFGLRLQTGQTLAEVRGHLPATWSEQEAGFECLHGCFDQLASTYAEVDFRRRWRHVLCLYFGTLPACVGACMAAASYARATDGLVFDPQEGRLMTPDEAAETARQTAAAVPEIEAHLAERARLRAERR